MRSLNETILTRDLSNNTALKDSKHIMNLLEIFDKIENLIKPDKIRKRISTKPLFGDNPQIMVTYKFDEDRYAEKKEYVKVLSEVKKIFESYFKNDPSVQIVLTRSSRIQEYSVRVSFGKGNGSLILSAEKVAYAETEVRTAFLLYAFIPSRMLSSFESSAKGFEIV